MSLGSRRGGFTFSSTTTSFSDASAIVPAIGLGGISFGFVSSTSAGSDVRVMASLDGGVTYPFTAVSSFALAASGASIKAPGLLASHFKIQARPGTTSQGATITGQWYGTEATPGAAV